MNRERKNIIIKGNIIFSEDKDTLNFVEDGYLVVSRGLIEGVFAEEDLIPKEYSRFKLIDHTGRLIIPGLVDLHMHAPQSTFRGIGMDMELIEWLNVNTFPEESRYADLQYANKAYSIYVDELRRSDITRAVIFATIDKAATLLLMDKLAESGICAYVGKVNMDRNSADYYIEESADKSITDTRDWIEQSLAKDYVKDGQIRPIITPRFVPTCSDELMKMLGELSCEYRLPVQSHLSENTAEVEWVKELCPWSTCYGDAYDRFGLFGRSAGAESENSVSGNMEQESADLESANTKSADLESANTESADAESTTPDSGKGEFLNTIMAHCIHCGEEEISLLKKNHVYIAHCPQSNINLSSGIAPVRRYLDMGMNIGLGTDISGGFTLSIMRAISDAIQVSKLRYCMMGKGEKPLRLEEAFYMATMGGGAFFGEVGTFKKGYAADILVIDDSMLRSAKSMTLRDRLERVVYMRERSTIVSKYVDGVCIYHA